MACPSNTQCQVKYLADIQREERSSADSTNLRAGKALYGYENAATAATGHLPTFKSGADYIRWKKTIAQMYSDTQKLTTTCR